MLCIKDFVSGVLTEIAQGIIDAQKKSGGEYCISPQHTPAGNNSNTHYDNENRGLECVNFDIAITSTTTVNGEVKTGLFVASGDIQGHSQKENISRITFPVYVSWPRQQSR